MLWRSHVLIGLNSLWLLAPLPGVVRPDNIGLLAVAAGVGALLPDLDAARAKVSTWDIAGVRPLIPVAAIINQTWGHRGLWHSLLGWLWVGAGCICTSGAIHLSLIPIIVSGLDGDLALLAVWLGYGSHLLADSCTRTGIPLFWGMKFWQGPKYWHLLPIKFRLTTGSLAEDNLLPVLALLTLTLLLLHLRLA